LKTNAVNIISKSWIGLLIGFVLTCFGFGLLNYLIIILGLLFLIYSIKHGKETVQRIEEERIWNEKNNGKLFFIFATKKKTQEYILANCIPDNCDKLILLFYDGPKIINQHGSINKYRLGNIYRNNHQMKIYLLSNGVFKEIEYLGNASYEIEDPLEIKNRIREAYNKYSS